MGGGPSNSGPDSEIRKPRGERIMSKQAVSSFKEIMDRDTKGRQARENANLLERLSVPLAVGNTIASFSRQKQLEQLAQGGTPVKDERGTTVGVVSQGRFGRTYTGRPGYDPIEVGQGDRFVEREGYLQATRSQADRGGDRDEQQEATPAPEAEAEEEAPTSMAMLPGETPSQYRRRVRRFGGGTIVEGGGVLYK